MTLTERTIVRSPTEESLRRPARPTRRPVRAFGETRDYTRFIPVPVEVPAPPSLSGPTSDATPELFNLQFAIAPLSCLE